MEKNIKFGDIEIQKPKFHQHKGPVSVKNIDIIRSLSLKKDLNNSLATKMLKKINQCAYFSPK